MADNAKCSYLGSVVDMRSGTGTDIVVAHTDEAQCGAGIVGQLGEVDLGRHMIAVDILFGDIKVPGDDLVDLFFDGEHLFPRRRL